MWQMARDDAGETAPAPTGRPGTVPIGKPLPRRLSVSIGLILVAALGLRLAAACGELWVDEIWSLTLVAPLHSAGEIFWGISHDNNHFLNSLWLYEAGPGRSALVYRLPAVLFGTVSVLVAARIGLRRGAATGIATAVLAASSFTLVNYGSEARGYAGLILAMLVAIDAADEAIAVRLTTRSGPGPGGPAEGCPSSGFASLGHLLPASGAKGSRQALARRVGPTAPAGARWILAGAVCFGTFNHLTMLSAVAAIGIAAAIRLRRAGGGLLPTLDSLVWLFWPAALALGPAAAALTAGILVRDGFTMGGAEPFSLDHFLTGYGGLLRVTAGLPGAVPAWSVLALVGAAAVLAVRSGLVGEARWPLLAAALAVVPGLMLAARLPNLEYPRYFLVAGVVLLLGLGEAAGSLWRRGGAARAGGVLLLAGVTAGQAMPLSGLLVDGRGSYISALTHMARTGPVTYASNAPFATRMVLDHAAPRLGVTATPLAFKACGDPRPDWVVQSSTTDGDAPGSLAVGPAACRAAYAFDSRYPASALSGLTWTLYRRAD